MRGNVIESVGANKANSFIRRSPDAQNENRGFGLEEVQETEMKQLPDEGVSQGSVHVLVNYCV